MGVRHEAAGLEIQTLPHRQAAPDVEGEQGEGIVGLGYLVRHRRQTLLI